MPSVLSIGALSKATGVPTETLRTWERRYGFPAPLERSDSGHRRYPLEMVDHIRQIVRALERGHKPALVVGADLASLQELLNVHDVAVAVGPPAGAPPNRDKCLSRWIEHVRSYDGDAFARDLRQRWNEAGAIPLMVDYLGPFLDEVGRQWSTGELDVAHEHFVSEHVREFLCSQWRQLSERAPSGPIVCATLPGEQHVLGLHMAAMAIAGANVSVVFLGANTPVADIARATLECKALGVALSASSVVPEASLENSVVELRARIPRSTPIVVGGAGFSQPIEGTIRRSDLSELAEWASARARDR